MVIIIEFDRWSETQQLAKSKRLSELWLNLMTTLQSLLLMHHQIKPLTVNLSYYEDIFIKMIQQLCSKSRKNLFELILIGPTACRVKVCLTFDTYLATWIPYYRGPWLSYFSLSLAARKTSWHILSLPFASCWLFELILSIKYMLEIWIRVPVFNKLSTYILSFHKFP